MSSASQKLVVAFVLGLLCAGMGAAQSKQEMLDEMVALYQEMRSLRGDSAVEPQIAQLQARYDALRAALGGANPAERLAATTGGAVDGRGPLGDGPPVPPNCGSLSGSFISTDTPIAFPVPVALVTSTINVSGLDPYLWNVNVATTITHTWSSDLQITLQSPQGTVVTLTSNNAGGFDNVYNGTTWDDYANPGGVPPYASNTGLATDHPYVNLITATPLVAEEALGAFIGENPNGNWILTIADTFPAADGGSLASWALTLTTLATPPVIAVAGPFPSTDTPIAISSSGTPVITSTLSVSGVDTFLSDVDVLTFITHTWNSDLQIALTSPAGTTVTLGSNNAGSLDNVYNGTVWNDSANPLGQVPYTNNAGLVTDHPYVNLTTASPLVPEEALAAFIGEDPNGNWVLTIADQADFDGGSLASWAIAFQTSSCVLLEADLGITKTGTAVGSNIVWTLEVTNYGPGAATGVVVTDPLSPCTSYISNDCGGANVPPFTWSIGNLASGASVTCNIQVNAAGCGVASVNNSASVSGNEADPTPANNAATAAVQVGSILEIPTLDMVGLLALLAALAGAGIYLLRRR